MQEFLIYIKQEIKRKVKLEKDKEELTDKKIIPLLEKENDLNNDEKKCYYIKLYTGLYFNNLKVLSNLESNNISLGIFPSNLSIYLLDTSFTKFFTNTSYITFITRYKPYLHSFFLSIKDLDIFEKEYYIKRFIKLLICLNDTLKPLENNSKTLINSLFTKKALDTFSDKTYMSANKEQLANIIASLESTPSSATIKRLNYLMTEKGFTMFFHNYDLMFELFSDEELSNMKISPEYFFQKTLDYGLDITRCLYIYNHYPDIIYNCGCLRKEIFNKYTNDEIIELSKTINFYSPNANKSLKSFNFKRRVLALLPWTK